MATTRLETLRSSSAAIWCLGYLMTSLPSALHLNNAQPIPQLYGFMTTLWDKAVKMLGVTPLPEYARTLSGMLFKLF